MLYEVITITSEDTFNKGISIPFNPDQMVYCGSEYLFIANHSSADSIVEEAKEKVAEFKARNRITSYNVCYTKLLRADVKSKLVNTFAEFPTSVELNVSEKIIEVLPAIRMLLSGEKIKTRNNFV